MPTAREVARAVGDVAARAGLSGAGPGHFGLVRPVGRDDDGRLVCVLPRAGLPGVMERAVRQVGRCLGRDMAEVLFVDAGPAGARWPLSWLPASPLAGYSRLAATVRLAKKAAANGRERAPDRARKDRLGGDRPDADRLSGDRPGGDRFGGRLGGRPCPSVIYYCYGSSHTSVVAAAIHTGLLDPGRLPSNAELAALPHFDRVPNAELGTVFPFGRGPEGEEVFVVGLGPGRVGVSRTIRSVLDLEGVPRESYLLVDALSRANWVVKAGGLASRRFGLVALGRPLASRGIRSVYPRLAALVRETQAQVRESSRH